MKNILLAFLIALMPSLAQAQVVFSGTGTPGHPVYFVTNGVIADAGTATLGYLNELGVTNSGQHICQNSGPVSGPYTQICLGATVLGGGTLSVFGYGGGSGQFTLNVNGQTQQLALPNPNVSTLRGPLVTDTSGYTAGNVWGFGNQAWVYTNQTNNGSTVPYWISQYSNSAPLGNATSVAPAAIYGSVLLVSGYAGNAFTITRASDSTTQVIGFVQGPWGVKIADWATVDKFCVGTTCTITTLNDQSGNTYNLTSVTGSPPPTNGNTINGFRAIPFAGCASCASPIGYQLVNQSISTATKSMSVFVVGRTEFGADLNTIIDFQNTNGTQPTGSNNLTFYLGHTQYGMELRSAGSDVNPTNIILPESVPSVFGFTSGASGGTFYNGVTSQNFSGVSSTTLTGLTLGNAYWSSAQVANLEGQFDFLAIAIYASQLSAADVTAFNVSASQQFNIAPQNHDIIAVIGDSIGKGEVATENQDFMQLAMPSLGRPYTLYNTGIGGAYCGVANIAWTSTLWSLLNIPSLVTPGSLAVAMVQCGTNDLFMGSATAVQMEGYQQTLCADAHAAGMKCVLMDILARTGTTGEETQRELLNAWDRANWQTFADAFADVGHDPIIGCDSGYTASQACAGNTTYFNNGIHPTTVGHAIMAGYVATAINSIPNVWALP